MKPTQSYLLALFGLLVLGAFVITAPISTVNASDEGDRDRDGYISDEFGGTDCDDDNELINPGALDNSKDGIDQDCDGVDGLDTDDDGDGILTKDEDLDGDGDPKNDDTDNDGVPNYLDPDDDGDGILTTDEDYADDGDPTNDDSDGDGTPDYLDADDDDDGIPTESDNCPVNANPDQSDIDDDGFGDVCDSDADGDGVEAGNEVDDDCDDIDPNNFPGNPEISDGKDNDCDNSTFTKGDALIDSGVGGKGLTHAKGAVKFFNTAKAFENAGKGHVNVIR